MSKLGQVLISAIEDAKINGLVTLQASPNVKGIRKSLKLSQIGFAKTYRINPETLKKWEQNKRRPDSVSLAYLKCIEKSPEMIKQLVNS